MKIGIKNPVLLPKAGIFFDNMKVQSRNRVGGWNLKTSAFISVAFHLLLLFTAANLFSDAAVHRAPIRFVTVALYRLDSENKPIPEPNPPLPVRHPLKKPEKKEIIQEEKQKEPVLKKELEPPVLLPVQSAVREIPAEEPKLISPPREEEKSLKESPPVTVIAALDPDLTLRKEELQPLPLPSSSEIGQGKNLSDSPRGDWHGIEKEGSNGGGSGDGSGPGKAGFRWKGFPEGTGLGQGSSDGGRPGGGAGGGTGSGQGDGQGGSPRKGRGFLAKLFSPSGGGPAAHPRYAENPKPSYPQEARERGYQGEVLLRVEVLSNGRVGRIDIKRSSGHEMLDQSALSTVKGWKFIPAKKGEETVSLWVNIPIRFQLQ